MNKRVNPGYGNGVVATRGVHLYATQRTRRRYGSGLASVDIQAWLLAFALAFLLRDDPYGSLPGSSCWFVTPAQAGIQYNVSWLRPRTGISPSLHQMGRFVSNMAKPGGGRGNCNQCQTVA